jgi:hypothetical protein
VALRHRRGYSLGHMSSRLGPAVASRARHRDPAHLLALLAALIFFLQLPGPATCSKLAWRFTAVPLETVEAGSDPRIEEPTAEPEAVAVAQIGLPHGATPSVIAWWFVPLARPHPVLDAGTARAPPLA